MKKVLVVLILIVSCVTSSVVFAEESSRLKRLQEKSEKMLEKALDLMYEDIVGEEKVKPPKDVADEFDRLMQEYLQELEEDFKKKKLEKPNSVENLLI